MLTGVDFFFVLYLIILPVVLLIGIAYLVVRLVRHLHSGKKSDRT